MNLVVEAADERCCLPLKKHHPSRTHFCRNCMPQRSDHQQPRTPHVDPCGSVSNTTKFQKNRERERKRAKWEGTQSAEFRALQPFRADFLQVSFWVGPKRSWLEAIEAVQAQLLEEEFLLTFLDDVHKGPRWDSCGVQLTGVECADGSPGSQGQSTTGRCPPRSPCNVSMVRICVVVARRRQETTSHKHGLYPPFRFHMKAR